MSAQEAEAAAPESGPLAMSAQETDTAAVELGPLAQETEAAAEEPSPLAITAQETKATSEESSSLAITAQETEATLEESSSLTITAQETEAASEDSSSLAITAQETETTSEESSSLAITAQETEAASEESSAQPPWVILGSVPILSAAENFLPGTDVFLRFDDPPTVSLVGVPRRIAPDYGAPDNYPYIVAVEAFAPRFLLYATQGLVERRFTNKREYAPAYFLCDARTGAASRLPYPAGNHVLHHGSVGLIADTRADGHCMVAELQPIAHTDHATLHCYSTWTGQWYEKEVRGRSRYLPGWGRDGVIAHEGRLWWVDLSDGLQACDPFADSPCLHHIPLPPSSVMLVGSAGHDRNRCVRVSAGKLRYVQLHNHPCQMEMVVTMWTLEGDAAKARWEREYQAPLSEIWADKSYVDTGMRRRAPVLATVNPKNPREVYFFLREWIFAVDVPARRVIAHKVCQMVGPPVELFSSRYVHAWELPPSLSRDAADLSSDSDSDSDSDSCYASAHALSWDSGGPDGEEGASKEGPMTTTKEAKSSCDVDVSRLTIS